MTSIGKWIGGFLGLLSGGPLGMLAGLVLGALFDSYQNQVEVYSSADRQTYEAEGERNGFLFSLMVLAAHVIHADGRIMHSEMEKVRLFLRINFSPVAETEGQEILLKLFERKKQMGQSQWDTQIMAVCGQIASGMPQSQRLQLVAFLCEIAKADGSVVPQEREVLRQICLHMGLDANTAEQMLGLGGSTLDDAYRVLGLSPSATDDEVRRAYKKMALENHPDRVASLGDDVRRAAEKKFKEINEAKERIYKARNMK